MQDTANALAVKIRAEDGVQEVVKYLESSFG
jgi:hypothetical protein